MLAPAPRLQHRILVSSSSAAARRPLVLGERKSAQGSEWCVASEDCAFGPIGFHRVRDVRPGEMIVITEEGGLSSWHHAWHALMAPDRCSA